MYFSKRCCVIAVRVASIGFLVSASLPALAECQPGDQVARDGRCLRNGQPTGAAVSMHGGCKSGEQIEANGQCIGIHELGDERVPTGHTADEDRPRGRR
jgi:riboflavin synthase alpha subunit